MEDRVHWSLKPPWTQMFGVFLKVSRDAVLQISAEDKVPEGGSCHSEGALSKSAQSGVRREREESSPVPENHSICDEEKGWVLGGKGKKEFVGKKEDDVGHVGFDQEPVKVDESWGDVLPRLGADENPGSRVLHIQPVKKIHRRHWKASVQAGGDNRMVEGLCHRVWEWQLESEKCF